MMRPSQLLEELDVCPVSWRHSPVLRLLRLPTTHRRHRMISHWLRRLQARSGLQRARVAFACQSRFCTLKLQKHHVQFVCFFSTGSLVIGATPVDLCYRCDCLLICSVKISTSAGSCGPRLNHAQHVCSVHTMIQNPGNIVRQHCLLCHKCPGAADCGCLSLGICSWPMPGLRGWVQVLAPGRNRLRCVAASSMRSKMQCMVDEWHVLCRLCVMNPPPAYDGI